MGEQVLSRCWPRAEVGAALLILISAGNTGGENKAFNGKSSRPVSMRFASRPSTSMQN